MTDDGERGERSPRSPVTLAVLGGLAAIIFVALIALGVWQVERRTWKHALIAQVDARIHAAPAAAPEPAAWSTLTAANAAYRRVAASGDYLSGHDVFVQATTALGGGYWVITPLRDRRGFTILINRGFSIARAAPTPPTGAVRVTGLLRITEPNGGFLRTNDPAGDRWYSRDVGAIARSKGLDDVAPYFIDADAASSASGGPVGGLTVVAFADNHLVYALTWFALALLLAGGVVIVGRDEWRVRRNAANMAR